jgi:hypothetical protein
LRNADVDFHSKNKFEKLVNLVGFIIRKFIMMHGHVNGIYKLHLIYNLPLFEKRTRYHIVLLKKDGLSFSNQVI